MCFPLIVLQEIIESFNYGLFFPPVKGRAGKFLDEDRCMKDYGLTDSTGILEVNFKYHIGSHNFIAVVKDLVTMDDRDIGPFYHRVT